MRIVLSTFLLYFVLATTPSSASEAIEVWQQSQSAEFARDLKRLVADDIFNVDGPKIEVDQRIHEISDQVASCWARSLIGLIASKNLTIEQAFLDPEEGHLNGSLFSATELRRVMPSCARGALRDAGLIPD